MAYERVLRNTAATVTVTFYNGSTAVDADTDPTIVIKRSNGTTLLSTTATNEPGVGIYSVVIPPQANLDVFTLTWTGTFTGTQVQIQSTVEIVGGFYFSIAELRNSDTALANLTKFPTEKLVEARMQVEAEFEDICGRAFVPRFNREYWRNSPNYYYSGTIPDVESKLWLDKAEPIRISALTINGVDRIAWYNSSYIYKDKSDPKALVLENDALAIGYASSVDISYEYGMAQIPVQIKQKALKRAKMFLVGQNSTLDERALTMTLPDIGTINLATPGQRGSETGVPDIDVVLKRYTLGGSDGGVY